MYKKEITYKDANRNEVREIVEIDCTGRKMIDYDFDALKKKVTKLEKIVDKGKNNRAILSEYFAFFDEIMHLGYGHSMEVELPNGEKVTRFIPASKEEVDGFTQSDGYVRMVLDFARNPESLGELIDQTFDPEHRDEVLDWLKNK